MKKKVLIFSVSAVLLVVAGYWIFSMQKQTVSAAYEPIEEFRPAYEALCEIGTERRDSVVPGTAEESYDIEETVRIMNALEVAQAQSSDFEEFLMYMARQDYSKVARDVINAKKKLFPVFQHMFELQKQLEDYTTVWMLARALAGGGREVVQEGQESGAVGLAMVGDGLALAGQAAKLPEKVFASFEEEKNIKKGLKKELHRLQMEYISYVEEFAPLYYKYMKEWNTLCLNKDKAYLDVYAGRTTDALNAAELVLKQSPENREGILLKALCLIQLGKGEFGGGIEPDKVTLAGSTGGGEQEASLQNPYFLQADIELERYLTLYPGRSAPALLLKGVLNAGMNNYSRAFSCFDQAAIEYPRQAEQLTDLLDAYRNRTYLNKTVEGNYLLNLYRSTMEGFGIFSPNFQKALYYSSRQETEKAAEEIYKHFFRRGNQGVYDCLLSDMNFCEQLLPGSFQLLLEEKAYIDVKAEPSSGKLWGQKEDQLDVKICNRSDKQLENVRLFLCLHYTGMYKDDYAVKKLPDARNVIQPLEEALVSVCHIGEDGKKVTDITRIRAILLTDDKICWVDAEDDKIKKAMYKVSHSSYREKGEKTKTDESLRALSLRTEQLRKWLKTGIRVEYEGQEKGLWGKSIDYLKEQSGKILSSERHGSALNNESFSKTVWGEGWLKAPLRIEIPRIFALLNPGFSLHSVKDVQHAVYPAQNFLAGETIKLGFDYQVKADSVLPLYIYSDYANFKVSLQITEKGVKVGDIEVI